MNSPTAVQPTVLVQVSGGLGRITLNRPRAINALDHDMVKTIQATLDAWRDDASVRTVVLDGAGERGFCAGGDVRALYEDALSGGGTAAVFWADEYRLDADLARYPKPVVALLDGLVMGGGVGLACHASNRVVSEATSIAMPEVTIGFSPDVGGSYLLGKAPGELGTHVGLTSGRMSAADALYCGFADVYVPTARRAELLAALSDADPSSVLAEFAEPVGESLLAAQRDWIDRCYAADTVEEIISRLQAEPKPDVAGQLAALSPTALKITLRALRLARSDERMEQSLQRELRVSVHSLSSHDFVEGIRAQIIDKDRNPTWQPSELADVDAATVDGFFESLGAGELELS